MTTDKKACGAERFPRLFSPWTLGRFPIANRICVPPLVMYTWGDDTGCVTERHAEHYRALAQGGAGLVLQEATAVCREGRLTPDQLGIWTDEQLPGLRRLAEVFHHAGLPAVLQLSHAGILAARPEDRVAPSAYDCRDGGRMLHGRELTPEELHTIEAQFISAACRAHRAGYDGVELHASHGYLLSMFLNPALNRRTDGYRVQDRLLLANILRGIRTNTPPDFLVGVRLGAFEPDLETSLDNARWLEAMGVDFLDVYYGCDWEHRREAPEGYPFNASIYGAARVKQAVDLLVFAVLGIGSGARAEAVLAETGMDMTAIGRGHLVNPRWGLDVAAGQDPGRCLDCPECLWETEPERCPGRKLKEQIPTI